MDIYTDGGCSGNPGPGGWAFVIELPGGKIEGSGAEDATTNNRMELTAVIRALERASSLGFGSRAGEVRVHTDSQYVKNGITVWIQSWKRNGWKTSAKEPVKNRELWEALDAIASKMELNWAWVKGHAGNPLNERCDSLVGERIRENRGGQ